MSKGPRTRSKRASVPLDLEEEGCLFREEQVAHWIQLVGWGRLCSWYGWGVYPYCWCGLQSRIFWDLSSSRSGGARLVWCPWEFITEFGDDFCRHHDVLKSYVAVLFQGWASKLLVELESGGVIGFVKITAQKWHVRAHHCCNALPRDPPWWWVVCGWLCWQRLDMTRLCEPCRGRLCLCVGHTVYRGRRCSILEVPGLAAWYLHWKVDLRGLESCSWLARGRPRGTGYSWKGTGRDKDLKCQRVG